MLMKFHSNLDAVFSLVFAARSLLTKRFYLDRIKCQSNKILQFHTLKLNN